MTKPEPIETFTPPAFQLDRTLPLILDRHGNGGWTISQPGRLPGEGDVCLAAFSSTVDMLFDLQALIEPCADFKSRQDTEDEIAELRSQLAEAEARLALATAQQAGT